MCPQPVHYPRNPGLYDIVSCPEEDIFRFFSATFPQPDVKVLPSLMKFFLFTYGLKISMNEEVLLKALSLKGI